MEIKEKWSVFDTIITITIVIVSITMTLVVWRSQTAQSNASGLDRLGMIDLIKQLTAINNNIDMLYKEMIFVREHDLAQVENEIYKKSKNPGRVAQAALTEQTLQSFVQFSPMMEPNSPLRNSNGSYNLDQRLKELNDKAADVTGLQPEQSFRQAGIFYAEQRWLSVGIVVLTISLFWISLAQITKGKIRISSFTFGVITYLIGLSLCVGIEITAQIGRSI